MNAPPILTPAQELAEVSAAILRTERIAAENAAILRVLQTRRDILREQLENE